MTAYAVPAIFSHGQYPNAVDLNTLSAAQTHLDEVLPTYGQHPLAFYNTNDSVQRWVILTHKSRYLRYFCDGSETKIMRYSMDFTDNNAWGSETWLADNSTSLGETNGNMDAIVVATYDLDSIDWLDYGDQYVVFDAWGCFEYDESDLPLEATPSFADTNLLSAAALNSLGRNIEAIKGNADAPVRPRLLETDDHWVFRKLYDNLIIEGTIMDDTVSSVAIYIGTDPSSMGAADFTLNNGGSGWAATDAFDSGALTLAGIDDGTDVLVKITESGSGYLRVERIYQTDGS